MSIPLLLAVTDRSWEATLVSALAAPGAELTVARRCLDLADLQAAAAAGAGRAALVSADLRRLDRSAITRLGHSGVAVVVAVPEGDEDAERRLRQWGLQTLVRAGADPDEVIRAALTVLSAPAATGHGRELAEPRADRSDGGSGHPAAGDPAAAAATSGRLDDQADPTAATAPGTVVAVWGPAGAPGRTTVALGLAAELAAAGRRAMLLDADVYAASVAQALGMLDESPGIAAACRQANVGRLDVPGLAALSPLAGPRWRVLTGITRAERWPELRPVSLTAVIDLARLLADVVVVDVGFCLEQDEELSFDTAAPRRNGATLAVLDAADTVVAVGSADPIGLQRLVRGLAGLREAVADVDPVVVVNRVRSGPVPGDAAVEIAAALRRFAGVTPVAMLPDDPAASDAALAAGRAVTEIAPDSRLRSSLTDLAGVVDPAAGIAAAGPGRRRGRRRRAARVSS